MKVEAVEEISKTEGGASHFSQFAFLFSFHTTVAALIETLWDQSVSDHILSPNTLTTIVSNYFFFFFGDSNMEVGTSGECTEHL